jgi:hypothetical protein
MRLIPPDDIMVLLNTQVLGFMIKRVQITRLSSGTLAPGVLDSRLHLMATMPEELSQMMAKQYFCN